MRILFAPFGSEGDVNPLLWIAEGLAARGHKPHFLITPHYRHLIESRGFPWTPVGNEEEFLKFARDPALWHATRGPFRVLRGMVDSLPLYQAAFTAAGSRFDLVITSSLGLGAAALAEAHKIPHITVHMQPICLRSVYDCPLFTTDLFWLPKSPPWVKALFFKLIDLLIWNIGRKPLNQFRRTLGLPAIQDFYTQALNGAQGIAALFPAWFAPAQPDWPANTRQFAFPLSPASGPLPAPLQAFLQDGPPPVLWTHGSANFDIKHFQSAALRSCSRLGLRCLLVSLDPPPPPLPPGAFHASHVSFSDLFPHCCAIVHHGGIGTTSKAIAAGIPQLIIPRSHDQPDNASRIDKLGLGSRLAYRHLDHPSLLETTLKYLVETPSLKERCLHFQQQIHQDQPNQVFQWIESIAR